MPFPTCSTEIQLVRAARDGDAAAWESLVPRYDGLLRAICHGYWLSESDTADVKQTTWLRACEHIRRISQPERFGGWLATVARHECLCLLRRAARSVPCDDEFLQRQADLSASPEARLLALERHIALHDAVVALAPRDRELLGLLYSDASEPSYADIGHRLQMPVGSIGPTRGRVLERLRRQAPLAELAKAN